MSRKPKVDTDWTAPEGPACGAHVQTVGSVELHCELPEGHEGAHEAAGSVAGVPAEDEGEDA